MLLSTIVIGMYRIKQNNKKYFGGLSDFSGWFSPSHRSVPRETGEFGSHIFCESVSDPYEDVLCQRW